MAKTTPKRPQRTASVRTSSKAKQPKVITLRQSWVVTALVALLVLGCGWWYVQSKETVTYESPEDTAAAIEEIDCMFVGEASPPEVTGCEEEATATVECAPGRDCAATLGSTTTALKPALNYGRVSYRGKAFTRYTVVLLKRAESQVRTSGLRVPSYIQGSFSSGVGASASTHARGGAVDVDLRGYSSSNQLRVLKAYRQAGFAAWIRNSSDGFSITHIHGIAIGDLSAHPQALAQVSSYFKGRNGLANNGKDRYANSVGYPIPSWARR